MSNSNLVVKMMSGENLADDNTSKGFTLVEAHGEVTCSRDANGKPILSIPLENGQTGLYHPEGNTYVIKNNKTVASFAYSRHGDCKATPIKGTLGVSENDRNEVLIVHETREFRRLNIGRLAEPVIHGFPSLQGREGDLDVVIQINSGNGEYRLYPGNDVTVVDEITMGYVTLSYKEVVLLLETGPINPSMLTNPVTGLPFQNFNLYFNVPQ